MAVRSAAGLRAPAQCRRWPGGRVHDPDGLEEYLWDRTCQAGYTNADLHQMADMRSVVNITPTVTVIPAQTAVPWKLWTIDVKPDVHAQETGVLQVRVSYASSGGAGQSQVMVDVLGTVAQTLSLPLPGDATSIQVIRLVGTIESNLVETATSTDTGTGVIVEWPIPFARAWLLISGSR